MTTEEKLTYLRSMIGDEDYTDAMLLSYLKLAGMKVIRKAYPFDPNVDEVPKEYIPVQLDIACYLINKRGAEGETTHTENGITRVYADADVPKSMLRYVVPRLAVPGGSSEYKEY